MIEEVIRFQVRGAETLVHGKDGKEHEVADCSICQTSYVMLASV